MSDKRLQVINLLDEKLPETEAADTGFAEDEIGPAKRITLNFSLALKSDPQHFIDNNFNDRAVSFEIGDGSLLPGFERVLFGLKAGDEREFILSPEDAFGLRNEDNLQPYPAYQFPADLPMQKGLMLNFSDAAGNEQAGVIHEFNADQVIVDFNHPLAGRDIIFRVAIKAVAPVLQ
jgi:FKBP-type peptidyl-prolyl cis-trans isomerase SlpA